MTLSQQELRKYLWGAATILRGAMDAGEYKNVIFPLLFFKRLSDVYDEEYRDALAIFGDSESAKFPENHTFQIPDGSHWSDVRKFTTNPGYAIRTAMATIEKANQNTLNGIFGDTNWTNKERLTDRSLLDLVEHFSSISLTTRNVPQDEFGSAYEYLIKQFADDSGHSAAEFYTNRTVVRLMTLIVDPQPGESIYDPTCGSGGMLLNARILVKERGKEHRSLKLYGQEINIITSAIARMNMFIHGVRDFQIVQGDTLKRPAFLENERLMQFDVCLANPPYSMKKWDREAWKSDPWGRNIYGTPSQGNADYAFFQHILCSLKEGSGRCAILWPHGVLFRDSEKVMRSKLVDGDLVEAVIGLGPNLFYNSTMESCIVVCRKKKPKAHREKILFVNATGEIVKENSHAFLSDGDINKISKLYSQFDNISGLTHVAEIDDIRRNDYKLSIPLYVQNNRINEKSPALTELLDDWERSSDVLNRAYPALLQSLRKVAYDS